MLPPPIEHDITHPPQVHIHFNVVAKVSYYSSMLLTMIRLVSTSFEMSSTIAQC